MDVRLKSPIPPAMLAALAASRKSLADSSSTLPVDVYQPGIQIPQSTPLIDTGAYSKAVSNILSVVENDLKLQKTPDADGLFLRPGTESIFRAQPQPGAKGTVVMYHGFTAGPWQYTEMAQRFFDAGYNVYVPRMPGHGYADATGMATGQKIPHPGQRFLWEAFIDRTIGEADALGAPVYVVGLSGGGNVALRAAEKHPEIKSAAVMAPYLGGDTAKALVFPILDSLETVTFGETSTALDAVPTEKNKRIPNDPLPHTEGSLGQAMLMHEIGHDVRHVGCPVQYFTTAGDFYSGNHAIQRMMGRSGGASNCGWYRFHADEHVPHAMLSPKQNKAPGAAQKVQDVVFNFIDGGIKTQRP